MSRKTILLFFTMTILCSGCGGKAATVTALPVFFTATLPPTSTPTATQTATLPAPVSVVAEETSAPPVEGTTTTQVNVRAEPSTASASLGIISIFVKVQITGKDASGSWYQILYTESATGKGWVRAEYVQVDAGAEIRLVETAPGSGSAVGGMVIQKVNVRNGPGTEFELLGVLNSNDLVFITGRDAGGEWIRIEFAGAPDGMGWVTADFLQAADIENAPLIGAEVEETPTPIVEIPATASVARTAAQDGDSMQSPLAVTIFSATASRALQVSGDVSAPDGDTEDWIQFKSQGSAVSIQITCPNTSFRAELWNNEKPVGNFSCGEASQINIASGNDYFLRLIQSEAGYTGYVLNLEVIP